MILVSIGVNCRHQRFKISTAELLHLSGTPASFGVTISYIVLTLLRYHRNGLPKYVNDLEYKVGYTSYTHLRYAEKERKQKKEEKNRKIVI